MSEKDRVPTFAAFGVRNYRLQFTAQMISETGAWFQTLAGALLVLEITGSAGAIAWLTVARFGPIALLGIAAGRLADRISPRTILMITATGTAATTGTLFFIVLNDPNAIAAVYVLAAVSGVFFAFERVTGQAFVYEIVGPGLLQNAVALLSTTTSVARSIGPAVAGLAYAMLGAAWCFLVHFLCTLITLVAVLLIQTKSLHQRRSDSGAGSGVIAAVRLVWSSRTLRTLLLVSLTIATLAMGFNVSVTAVVDLDFGGDAAMVGVGHALNAVGGVVGGILVARFGRPSLRGMVLPLLLVTASLALCGVSPTLLIFLLVSPFLGAAFGIYTGTLLSAVQVASPPSALGRVMSLQTIAQQGASPVAALIAGVVVDLFNGRAAFGLGTVVSLLCAIVIAFMTMRRPKV